MFFKVSKSQPNIVRHKISFAFDFPVEIESIRIVFVEIEKVGTVNADFLSIGTGWKL